MPVANYSAKCKAGQRYSQVALRATVTLDLLKIEAGSAAVESVASAGAI